MQPAPTLSRTIYTLLFKQEWLSLQHDNHIVPLQNGEAAADIQNIFLDFF
jgi:hypothetical protein